MSHTREHQGETPGNTRDEHQGTPGVFGSAVFKAGIECGEHKGKVMIITRALYGLTAFQLWSQI